MAARSISLSVLTLCTLAPTHDEGHADCAGSRDWHQSRADDVIDRLSSYGALGLAQLTLLIVSIWCWTPNTFNLGTPENSTVLLAGGVPHPSGYPWLRSLGGLDGTSKGGDYLRARGRPAMRIFRGRGSLLARASSPRDVRGWPDPPALAGAFLPPRRSRSGISTTQRCGVRTWPCAWWRSSPAVRDETCPIGVALAPLLQPPHRRVAVPLASVQPGPAAGHTRRCAGALGLLGSALGCCLCDPRHRDRGAWRWGRTPSPSMDSSSMSRDRFGASG